MNAASARVAEHRVLVQTDSSNPQGLRVGLLSRDKKDFKRVSRILCATGGAISELTLERLADPSSRPALALVNYDHLDGSERDRLGELVAKFGYRPNILIYTSESGRDQFQQILETPGVSTVLANHPEVEPRTMLVTAQKILRGDIFGLRKYFSWGARVDRAIVRSSDAIPRVLDEADEFASSFGLRKRFRAALVAVADELLTNAVYNAPRDANGKPLYAHEPRTTRIELSPEEEVEFAICSDGTMVGVGVTDVFGTLDEALILDYLKKCFRRGEDQIDDKAGGAGLGIYWAFANVSHLVFNLAPAKRTEVIGLLDIRGSYRDFVGHPKSLSVFVEE